MQVRLRQALDFLALLQAIYLAAQKIKTRRRTIRLRNNPNPMPKNMKLLVLFSGLIFSLILSGCGAKPEAEKKVESQADSQILSFKNNFEKAYKAYWESYMMASQTLGLVLKKADEMDQSYPGSNFLPTGLKAVGFGDSITNAESSIDSINQAEPDFQHIYTSYKEIHESFKTDFYKMKDIMGQNLSFIQGLKEGEIDKDAFQEWMDNFKKMDDLHKSVLLEIERMQKP